MRGAALALAAAVLTALPYKGTEADLLTKLLEATSTKKNFSTINKTYQMLHNSSFRPKHSDINHIYIFNHHDFDLISHNNITSDGNVNKNLSGLVNEVSVSEYIDNGLKERYNGRPRSKRTLSVLGPLTDDKTAEVSSQPTLVVNRIVVTDRKRKPDVGSGAPLLNYIFDTYSNTHQHRNDRPGAGSNIYAAVTSEVTALVGSTARLDCKVDALHDKMVSWVRRKNGLDAMELLTTGTQQYTADNRYSAVFVAPDVWRLEVREVRPSDAAFYDCQLSAHPPRSARIALHVPEVSVRIVDNAGAPVSEQVCEVGSTVALRCEVRGLRVEGGRALLWRRGALLLNDDTTRGGISVRTEFTPSGADSVLGVARVRGSDAGDYTCSVAPPPPIPVLPAHVLLHVIKGESLAELHQGGVETVLPNVILLSLAAVLCF